MVAEFSDSQAVTMIMLFALETIEYLVRAAIPFGSTGIEARYGARCVVRSIQWAVTVQSPVAST